MKRSQFAARRRLCWGVLLSCGALFAPAVCLAQSARPTTIRLQPTGGALDSPVVTALAIDPRGQLIAAAGDDHVIRIFRQQDLEEIARLEQHTGWVRSLAFSPDGATLASAGDDGRLVLWQRGGPWRTEQALDGAPALFAVRFAPAGGVIGAVGFDPQLFLIGRGGTQRPALQCGCRDMRSVAFSDDGQLVVAAGRSGDVHLFHPATGQPVGTYAVHSDRVREAIFMKGSRILVSVGEDGAAVVFDTAGGQVLHTVRIQDSKLFAVAQLDAHHVAVGGADNEIRILDVRRGVIVRQLAGHTGSVSVLAANERYLFSGSFDTTLRRWTLDVTGRGERIAETEPVAPPAVRTSRLPEEH